MFFSHCQASGRNIHIELKNTLVNTRIWTYNLPVKAKHILILCIQYLMLHIFILMNILLF